MKRLAGCILLLCVLCTHAQNSFKLKYKNSEVYAGIDIGSRGVKLSVLEINKSAGKAGSFNILKESSVNTDFIQFTDPSFAATLNGLQQLYNTALNEYNIPASRIFTVISSGVKGQAEKENKNQV